ncbi:MAG TPA: PQQ-binding-like beta-propeller repeat protein [Nitrososphaerales archaeon]|nr:PQQ-binding-like beta-propeller repeat protein [Nitrososphaerales archaeon]
MAAAAVAALLVLAGAIYFVVPPQPGAPQSSSSSSSPTSTSTSTSSSTPSGSASPSTTTSTSSRSSSTTAISSAGQGWTTYHRDNARTGYLPASNFTSVAHDWTSATLDGDVYAEPLVFGGDVFVATENNSVYSLDAKTGNVLWRTNLGPPVDASTLPCGNISPVTGITGTPVIDPSTGMLYVVSYSAMHHTLSALKVSTGAVAFQRSAVPPGFVELAQQERSALSLANGMVYVPYGGLAGDCGQYYGWVAGIPTNGTGNMVAYKVPTSREAGIWTPSGAAVDSSGNVYVTTGNGASSTTFDYGNSVIKLSPSLSVEGYFTPTNWAALSGSDTDVGSDGPAFIGPNTIFQIGKEGVGYLLDSNKLGGVGGQTFAASVCGGSFGGTAYAAPYVFVPCRDGLVELQVANGAFTTVWHTSSFFAGPPVVTGGVVWTVNRDSATLQGYSVSTGYKAYSFPLGSVLHFVGPAAGEGRVFVTSTDRVMSFLLGA